MSRQASSKIDDKGRQGQQPLIKQPVKPVADAELSSKIKYATNVQDVSSNVASQLSTVVAIGAQIGPSLAGFQDDTDFLVLEDQEIGMAASVAVGLVASFIWFVKNRNNTPNKTQKFDRIRKAPNHIYRRFKTAMAFGNAIGSSAVEVALVFVPIPVFIKKPIKVALGYIVGLITGLIGAFLPIFKDGDPQNTKSIFRFGRDGWSKYAKAGILPGSTIGAAIGAVIGFLLPIPGGMMFGAALGGALGSAIGFLSFAIFIPLINKIAGKNFAGEKYRSQYVRTGSLGGGLGMAIGFVVGLFLPFPGAAYLCAIVGAAIGLTLGAVIIGVLGPRISRKISRDDMGESSWDYGFRSSSMIGSQFGLSSIILGVLTFFGLGTEHKAVLKDVLAGAGAFITGIFGSIYDAIRGKKAQKKYDHAIKQANAQTPAEKDKIKTDFDAKKPILPWSDRTRTFGTLGGFFGGVIGFLIGTLVGGPIGGTIGFLIGTGVGGLISFGVGVKWGNTIYKKMISAAKALGDYFAPPPQAATIPRAQSSNNLSSSASLNLAMQPPDDPSSSPGISPNPSRDDLIEEDSSESNSEAPKLNLNISEEHPEFGTNKENTQRTNFSDSAHLLMPSPRKTSSGHFNNVHQQHLLTDSHSSRFS